ncbi:MAG: hypothetical protein AAGF98_00370 [Cyanobacteria bacterium P01_H01_bin.153]
MCIDGFLQAREKLVEKQGFLELELITAEGVSKFNLQQKIDECEKQRQRLEGLIAELRNNSFLDLPNVIATGLTEPSVPDASEGVVKQKRAEDLPQSLEDQNSAHLAIAVFLQGGDDQKIYLQHRLFHYDTGDIVSIKLVLPHEQDAIAVKQFPSMLKALSEAAAIHLSKYFSQSLEPWRLTVELFVPVELLCLPMASWCASYADLLRDYPIVLGCSDRFDPRRRGNAARLLNKMKRGWQRFQRSIPDESREPLNQLHWLDSERVSQTQESLESYAGFQCFGTWLKPDKKALNKWCELVESGIPIVLWVCGGQSERTAVEPTFKRITEYTRFEFLEEVRIIRDEQQKTGQNLVGVFYEDPNYALKMSQVPFAWPKQRPDPSGRGG